jgi:hypothetical protein
MQPGSSLAADFFVAIWQNFFIKSSGAGGHFRRLGGRFDLAEICGKFRLLVHQLMVQVLEIRAGINQRARQLQISLGALDQGFENFNFLFHDFAGLLFTQWAALVAVGGRRINRNYWAVMTNPPRLSPGPAPSMAHGSHAL